ncbi:oligosaccharide flippase family protein [Comamonadaceae bacterium G21597-S1]|nr:oligosaccharide flippase family protein [Comamonadaceae bacterium G21597-S1]
MAVVSDILFMGTSTAVRLVSGLLTFVILARLLGLEPFGILMLWLSIATLLATVANYGFTTYLLREIGHSPGAAGTVVNEVFASKVLLSAVILAGALCAIPFLPSETRWVFLLLLLAMLLDSTSDFLNVGYRVTNRFSAETRMATVASVSQFVIVAGAVTYQTSVLMAAFGLLASRCLVLLMTWSNQRQYFSALRPAPLHRAVYRLKHGGHYAIDFGLQGLIGQIDSVVLNYFLGPVAVGLHQAGMRVFLGGSQIAKVLGNVFIPRVSRAMGRTAEIQHIAERVETVFFGSGAAVGLLLAITAKPLVQLLFGENFMALAHLMPWFGLLFFVRFVASGFGLLLTAAGKQALRAKVNLGHWIVILISAAVLVPRFGNLGWIWALTIGNLMLALIYFRAIQPVVSLSRLNAGLALLCPLAFIPFVQVH